jgi:S-adenosylmethionine decarboxylase
MVGHHYLIDVAGCDASTLNDEEYLKKLLEAGAIFSGATVLKTESHKFSPQGVTAFCLLSDSHISIHTWPEDGRAAIDMFTCGDCDSKAGVLLVAEGLGGVIIANTLAYRCQGMIIPDHYEP